MEFKKKKDSLFTEGTTKNGHSIAYVFIDDANIVFFDPSKPELIKEKGDKHFREVKPPTRLVFYCNFEITTSMASELEQSKILMVDSLSNENKQIIAYPLFGFNYSKLENVLASLAEKYNL
ncbi:hypothetical protein [Dysgonomonas sp. HGC4]|uniref:hypothetical protein n=1 Tax=Dysgonomonas sp. HGC4 TaxID=1658009 RepID=UPI00068331D0|nr:hypothetical protein [Dysgonomonas sp. HGC4]MBD8349383.1 hypothetical protein [Dysgonomonas sp. HGC4]